MIQPSTHGYDRDGFFSVFFPEAADRAEVEAGAQALIDQARRRAERASAPGSSTPNRGR